LTISSLAVGSTNVENGSYTPSIYKLYSFEASFIVTVDERPGFLWASRGNIGRDQPFSFAKHALVQKRVGQTRQKIVLPVRMRETCNWKKRISCRGCRNWGENSQSPFGCKHLDLAKVTVRLHRAQGLHDVSTHPPGSFVQIDGNQRKVKSAIWRTEFERPIYFIELHEATCVAGRTEGRTSEPNPPIPNSSSEIRASPYPQEAEIVGRVTA